MKKYSRAERSIIQGIATPTTWEDVHYGGDTLSSLTGDANPTDATDRMQIGTVVMGAMEKGHITHEVCIIL